MSNNIDAKIKEKGLVNKSDIPNIVRNSELNYDLSYYLGKIFLMMMVYEMFVYQPTLSMLQLQKGKGTHYILNWKSKGLYTSILFPKHSPFLHSVKFFGYEIGIKFDKDPLAVEQKIYTTKIVNAYIVYELGTCRLLPSTFVYTRFFTKIQFLYCFLVPWLNGSHGRHQRENL